MKDTSFAWLIVVGIVLFCSFTGYASNQMEQIKKAQKEMCK